MSSTEKCQLRKVSVKNSKQLFCNKNKRLNKFYKQQSNLLESFENDSKQIQSKKVPQNSSCEDDPSIGLLQSADGVEANSSAAVNDDIENGTIKQEGDVERQSLFQGENDHCSPHVVIDGDNNENIVKISLKTRHLALITLCVNVVLTVAKLIASYLSGSLSIISSLVDSLVDITSGLVIWLTSRAIRKHDPYLYPAGRTRLEPIALVIVSVIMAVASVQMVLESLESVIHGRIKPQVDIVTISIMVSTILIKMVLFLCCCRDKDPSIKVLALDHRNDCLSNFIALVCAFCAEKYWIYLDPIGAILVAIYIAATWFRTGRKQLMMLSGRAAKPDFINRIIKLCIDHDDRIDFIDTVHVYHFGTRLLVEVHVVLDENMRLKEAHDITENLQNDIESLPEVERAFVHADYEYTHKPRDEHKLP